MPADKSLEDDIVKALHATPGKALGAGYQATVSLHETPAGRLVLKQARSQAGVRLAGLAREHEIYTRLSGIPGIPKTYGMLHQSALVLEYIEGDSLRERESGLRDREAFFEQLLKTIDAMHAAGVAHCDLKRKDNTLVGPGETPYLVDFGVACILGQQDGPIKRWWFRLMRQMDFNAWVKLNFGRNPIELPPAVADRYHPLWIEKIARWIRIPWQKITLRRARQKWNRRD